MAVFPSITPSGRTYTAGDYPHTPFTGYSGWQNRVRHSNVMLASQVRLSFTALTEADMLSILSHYNGQYGSFDSFALPSAAWSGATATTDYQLSGYLWRYIEPPTVEDVYCDRYNVALTLETVPPDGAVVDGAWYNITATLQAASVAAASGLSKTVTITLTTGTTEISGYNATISATLGAASGALLATTASLTDGAATGGGGAADYWADMAVQLYGWEQTAYIEWWGN